jgi:outer membrane protein assembly factor BamB
MAGAGSRCPDCGVTWSPGARYCGRCGHRLTATGSARRRPSARRSPTGARWLAVAAGCAALVGVTVWVVAGSGTPPAPAPRDLGVEVPAVEAPTPVVFRRPEVGCAPPDCTRWTVEVGHGVTTVLPDGIYHVTRTELVAVDPADGTVRWRSTLRRPSAHVIDAGSHPHAPEQLPLLVTDDRSLQAWDRTSGRLRWETPWPLAARVVDTGLVGDHLLLATAGALPFGAGDADRSDWPPRTGVVALDTASGQLRWTLVVDEVVAVTPLVLVLVDGELRSLDPGTGRARWTHPAVAADVSGTDDEVVVVDTDGVAILGAVTGDARARLGAGAATGAAIRTAGRGRLVAVATRQETGTARSAPDEWELVLYDRADGRERRRYPRARTWAWSDDGLLFVLSVTPQGADLDAVSTREVAAVWRTPLPGAEGTIARLEPRPAEVLLVSLAAARDDVEVVTVDARSGDRLGRYGGAGWHALGDGLLAHGPSEPVVGSIDVTRLAGPEGQVEFTRRVRMASSRPLVVAYWDQLMRIDEQLLTGPGTDGPARAEPGAVIGERRRPGRG